MCTDVDCKGDISVPLHIIKDKLVCEACIVEERTEYVIGILEDMLEHFEELEGGLVEAAHVFHQCADLLLLPMNYDMSIFHEEEGSKGEILNV